MPKYKTITCMMVVNSLEMRKVSPSLLLLSPRFRKCVLKQAGLDIGPL